MKITNYIILLLFAVGFISCADEFSDSNEKDFIEQQSLKRNELEPDVIGDGKYVEDAKEDICDHEFEIVEISPCVFKLTININLSESEGNIDEQVSVSNGFVKSRNVTNKGLEYIVSLEEDSGVITFEVYVNGEIYCVARYAIHCDPCEGDVTTNVILMNQVDGCCIYRVRVKNDFNCELIIKDIFGGIETIIPPMSFGVILQSVCNTNTLKFNYFTNSDFGLETNVGGVTLNCN